MYVCTLWLISVKDSKNLVPLQSIQQVMQVLQKNMSSDNINQIMVEKLDKNNFHAWRFRITNFLMGKGY